MKTIVKARDCTEINLQAICCRLTQGGEKLTVAKKEQ